MVVEELDALRDRFEGCSAIAFADLSTRMILVTDSGSDLRREALDALCAEAALTLGADGATNLGTQPGNMAVVTNPTGIRVFLRAAGEPNDVLCCICAAPLDVGAFVADARSCLGRISDDG